MPIIQSGEYLIDEETGEIVDCEAIPEEEFHIDSVEKLEWYLGKQLDLTASIDGLKSKLKRITDNIDALIKQDTNKAEWLRRRFEAEVEDFTRKELDGKKQRSIKTAYGTAGFRKVGGNLKIAGGAEDAAVEWCKLNAPDAVKTVESVLVSKLDVDKEKMELTVKKGEKVLHIPLDTRIFTIEPETDKFYIK